MAPVKKPVANPTAGKSKAAAGAKVVKPETKPAAVGQ